MNRFFMIAAVISVALTATADASAPAGRYTVASGTVYDTKTKLTWQQAVPSTTYSWADASTYCAGVGATLGGSGWRLPTFRELITIVDFSQSTMPTVDTTAFPATPAVNFWSLTPAPGSSTTAMHVSFGNGSVNTSALSEVNAVRCVH